MIVTFASPTWIFCLEALQVNKTAYCLAVTVIVLLSSDWFDQRHVMFVCSFVKQLRLTAWLTHTVSTPSFGDETIVIFKSSRWSLAALSKTATIWLKIKTVITSYSYIPAAKATTINLICISFIPNIPTIYVCR